MEYATEVRDDDHVIPEREKLNAALNVCSFDRTKFDDPEIRKAAEKRILDALK